VRKKCLNYFCYLYTFSSLSKQRETIGNIWINPTHAFSIMALLISWRHNGLSLWHTASIITLWGAGFVIDDCRNDAWYTIGLNKWQLTSQMMYEMGLQVGSISVDHAGRFCVLNKKNFSKLNSPVCVSFVFLLEYILNNYLAVTKQWRLD